jgi:hypothetical protein
MVRKLISAAVVCALCSTARTAQAVDYVVPVYLSATGGTTLTDRFIYEFKEAIRRSSTLSISDSKEDSFQIASLTALNIREEGVAYSFARSWRIGDQEIFVTHYVGVCDADGFSNCARNLLAILATGVDQDRATVLDGMKKEAKKQPSSKKSL